MQKEKLSVIIPAYNENQTIEVLLQSVLSNPSKIELEIIVVDDFSTDGTRELLQKKLSKYVTKLCLHERNQGKGAAIRTGILAASGTIILIQDADLEYDPNQYPKLLQPILDGRADVVYGSRRVLYFWHKVGNNLLTLFSNLLTNLALTDMETCYKVFKSSVIKDIRIQENRFGFEPEITAKIAKKKVRVYEVGISYSGRTYLEGKKIGWKDGFRALYCIIKYNLFSK